ncbi:MAG: OmpA family protein [Ferruginibacter sp.]
MKKACINFFLLISATAAFAQKEVENLGNVVNTQYSEARPTISADGKQLYFIVESNPKNTMSKKDKYAQDIWYSELGGNGQWGAPIQASAPLNDMKDNAVFWVSPDGNRLLIRGAYVNGKYAGRGISMVQKTAAGWGTPEKLDIKDYERMAVDRYSGAFLSNDGKTLLLYFSEEENTYLNDIYVSHLTENNDWTTPVSLGPVINTYEYDEITPCLAADGETLYFSSDRPGGYGDHDIYVSRRLDDSWTKWSQPVNMGSPINTAKWDAYFAVDGTGDYGYFSSTQNAVGGTDLVRIKLDEKLKPKLAALIFGRVYNAKTKEPMDVQILFEELPGEANVGNAVSGPTGDYKMTLPYGKKYVMRAAKDNFFSILDTVDLVDKTACKDINRDLYLSPVDSIAKLGPDGKPIRKDIDEVGDGEDLEEGTVVDLKNIHFDFGKSMLRADAFDELNKVIRLLKKNPDMRIELSAHTDNIGGYSTNMGLSKDRANAAKQFLLSKGIEAGRIVAKGYGEVKPIAKNRTEEGRQKNRRVEFVVLKK